MFATLTIVIFDARYTCIPNEHITSILISLKLLWWKEESYHDFLEELFILQNTADLKAIRYKVFIFDFGFKLNL